MASFVEELRTWEQATPSLRATLDLVTAYHESVVADEAYTDNPEEDRLMAAACEADDRLEEAYRRWLMLK